MAITATTGDRKIVTLHTHYENNSITVTIHKKDINNIIEISSIHEFSDSLHDSKEEGKEGYDWYFIKQSPLLNGKPGYDSHWAGTRQTVWTKQKNGTVKQKSWYVGQGDVALYYVSSYTLSAYINGSKDKVKIYSASPTALNQERTQTVSDSYSVGGAFSGGITVGGQDKFTANGSASLNWGLNYEQSETTTIYDCTCSKFTEGSSVKWKYTFDKPTINYQKLKHIAELSHSTFNPVNLWIWRVPTSMRQQVKSFTSEITVEVSSIIARYSGSQPAKVIPGDSATTSFTIDLPTPALLSCETGFISIDGSGGTKTVAIMSEYENLVFSFDGNPSCDWVHVDHKQGHTENSVLSISVDEMDKVTKKRDCTIKITGNNTGAKKGFQGDSDITESIELVITQAHNLID